MTMKRMMKMMMMAQGWGLSALCYPEDDVKKREREKMKESYHDAFPDP